MDVKDDYFFFKKTETLHTRTKQYALYFRSVS